MPGHHASMVPKRRTKPADRHQLHAHCKVLDAIGSF
jgi:hypothetical protein